MNMPKDNRFSINHEWSIVEHEKFQKLKLKKYKKIVKMPYLIYPSEYLNDCKYSENNELKLTTVDPDLWFIAEVSLKTSSSGWFGAR